MIRRLISSMVWQNFGPKWRSSKYLHMDVANILYVSVALTTYVSYEGRRKRFISCCLTSGLAGRHLVSSRKARLVYKFCKAMYYISVTKLQKKLTPKGRLTLLLDFLRQRPSPPNNTCVRVRRRDFVIFKSHSEGNIVQPLYALH